MVDSNKLFDVSQREFISWSAMAIAKLSREFTEWLRIEGFYTAPASTKWHGDYDGGLFDHSLEVMNALVEFTRKFDLVWEKQRSPYIVGMFHDLCKILFYGKDEKGKYFWREDAPKGHGDLSVEILKKWIPDLTEEEEYCILYHMGAFTEKEKWNAYGDAIKKYPNVLWTHHADMYATKIKGV
jgi:hypothetical protein